MVTYLGQRTDFGTFSTRKKIMCIETDGVFKAIGIMIPRDIIIEKNRDREIVTFNFIADQSWLVFSRKFNAI